MAIPTRPAPLKTHQQTGFTLVEVLVAMMVMAILAAMHRNG